MAMKHKPNVFSEKVMSVAEASYVAAFVDGEGSIGLWARKDQFRRSHSLLAALVAANTDIRLLDTLVEKTGNGRVMAQRRGPNHKDCFRWELAPRQVHHVLAQIEPYLVGKRRQAQIVLRYIELQDLGRSLGHRGLRDEDIPEVLALHREIQLLNQRGTTEAEELELSVRDRKSGAQARCSETDCTDHAYPPSKGDGPPYCYKHWLHRREPVIKTCEFCGGEMDALRAAKRFCSSKCQVSNYHFNVLKPAEAAKRLHTQRCPGCSQNFKTNYASKKYCSRPCYLRHRRAILHARENGLPEPTALATPREKPRDETQETLDL